MAALTCNRLEKVVDHVWNEESRQQEQSYWLSALHAIEIEWNERKPSIPSRRKANLFVSQSDSEWAAHRSTAIVIHYDSVAVKSEIVKAEGRGFSNGIDDWFITRTKRKDPLPPPSTQADLYPQWFHFRYNPSPNVAPNAIKSSRIN